MQNHEEIPFIDVFSEISINLYRLCIIIEKLQYNRQKKKVLTLEKLLFIDAVIVDANLVKKINLHFNPKILVEILDYKTYINYTLQTLNDVLQGDTVKQRVMELYSLGLIDVIVDNGEIFLINKNIIQLNIDNGLVREWNDNLNLLKPFMNKSINQLINSLMDEIYD